MNNKIIKEQKEAAKIWANELKDKNAIENKIKETEESLKNYIKLSKIYNWHESVVNENILAYNTFIKELKNYL